MHNLTDIAGNIKIKERINMKELFDIVMEVKFLAGFLAGFLVGACTMFCFMAMAIGKKVQRKK